MASLGRRIGQGIGFAVGLIAGSLLFTLVTPCEMALSTESRSRWVSRNCSFGTNFIGVVVSLAGALSGLLAARVLTGGVIPG
jgi:hypothetical protein